MRLTIGNLTLRLENNKSKIQERFRSVYINNDWKSLETKSGEGSELNSPCVADSINFLDFIIRKYNIKSICDAPCGDFNWIPYILGRHRNIKYVGYDVVPEIIKKNRNLYPSSDFSIVDLTTDTIPKFDLIFCKDLINHIEKTDIFKIIKNFKYSGSKYIIFSNNDCDINNELPHGRGGDSRMVNLLKKPFLFPDPDESCGYLSMWKNESIPEY